MSMHEAAWGISRPNPITESKHFNAARKTVTLLVESGVDEGFWRQFCVCEIRHQHQGGRPAVLKVLLDASTQADAELVAILDADFDRLSGQPGPNLPPEVLNRIVWTDGHDLETTLLGLPVLEKLLAFELTPERLTLAETRWRETFRARLFRHARGAGRLRWLSLRQSLGVEFRKEKKGELESLDYGKAVGKDWEPSAEHLVKEVRNFSNQQTLVIQTLVAQCESLPPAEDAQLCNGHDLIGFLGVGLLEIGASRAQRTRMKYRPDELTERVMLACERTHLMQTQMWAHLKHFEAANPGFQVLK